MDNTQEILTYEILKNNNNIYLHIPVSGLINPQYLLKNNCLYIFLYNYTQAFVIKNLSTNLIEFIVNNNAYLIESLSYDNQQEHLIQLIPNNISILDI
jgi:hypothetical protein